MLRKKLDWEAFKAANSPPGLNRLKLTNKRLAGVELILANNPSSETVAMWERIRRSLVAEVKRHTAGPMPPSEAP